MKISMMEKAQLLQSYPFPILPLLEKFTDELDKDILGQKLARFCVQKYLKATKPKKKLTLKASLENKDEQALLKEAYNKQSIIQIANDHLSKIGLKVSNVKELWKNDGVCVIDSPICVIVNLVKLQAPPSRYHKNIRNSFLNI